MNKEKISKWCNRTSTEKFLYIIQILLTIGFLILSFLYIFHVYENIYGLNYIFLALIFFFEFRKRKSSYGYLALLAIMIIIDLIKIMK